MFNDVQKLKLAEAEDNLQTLRAEEEVMNLPTDVRVLSDKISAYKSRLKSLQSNQKNQSGEFYHQNISVLKRLFSAKARNAYQTYQNALAELKTLPDRISRLTSELEIAEKQVKLKIADSGILQKIKDAFQECHLIESAKCLSDLGINPIQAIELLEHNNIVPLLDESDNAIFERPREYETKGKAALCAVHKTDVVPENNYISTLQEAGVKRTEKVTIDGKEYEYSYFLERNTVHWSMNDEVSSHWFGDWDKCRYCILQPFNEIPNEQIGAMMPNDTYTRGGVNLTQNAWILCPANEVEAVKKLNPHVHVLGYKKEHAMGLAAPFLSQLGYRAEGVGQWGWDDWESQRQCFDIAQHEKLNKVQHSNSADIEDEHLKINLNKMIAILKMLTENNLIQSVSDIERLRKPLKICDFDCLLANVLNETSVVDRFPELIYDGAIIANHRQFDVLAEKLRQAGMPLSREEEMELKTVMQGDGAEFKQKTGVSHYEFMEQMVINSALRAHTMQADRTM